MIWSSTAWTTDSCSTVRDRLTTAASLSSSLSAIQTFIIYSLSVSLSLRLSLSLSLSLLSILTAIFPSETRLAGFIGAKDDGSGCDNWSHNLCKALVKSSPPTNQHPTFYGPDALPVAQRTALKHQRDNAPLAYLCLSLSPTNTCTRTHTILYLFCLSRSLNFDYQAKFGFGQTTIPAKLDNFQPKTCSSFQCSDTVGWAT